MKVYADTSVFGGVFDEEFAEHSRRFFEEIRAGKFKLVVSALVEEEMASAPKQVRRFFDELSPLAKISETVPEVLVLRDAYLNAEVVTRKSKDDATHVTLTTVSGCELIVSWNFKHIVHFQKVPKYNAVNTLNGYRSIDIYSPMVIREPECIRWKRKGVERITELTAHMSCEQEARVLVPKNAGATQTPEQTTTENPRSLGSAVRAVCMLPYFMDERQSSNYKAG